MTIYLVMTFVCGFAAGLLFRQLLAPDRPTIRPLPPKHVDLLIEMQLPRGTECRECLAGKIADACANSLKVGR